MKMLFLSNLRNRIHVLRHIVAFCDFCHRQCTQAPQVASKEETIRRIINEQCSISRFGDYEFALLGGENVGYQRYDKVLVDKMFSVLNDTHTDFLVGIPDTFSGFSHLNKDGREWWGIYMWRNRSKLYRILDRTKYYYNTNISRPYMIYKNKKRAAYIFELLKKVWNDRNIILVEGEQSRLGVGNDLLSNARSIRRILCPGDNAFDKYQQIQDAINKTYQAGDLVLIALGPTATVLAYDLYLAGIQAIDIGHVDIEYSWMKMKVLEKVPVPGKYTNEVNADGGTCLDSRYLSEIIEVVKK